MCMSHSDGLYSLLDSPEPRLSDLFGSTTLAGSIIASAVEGVARACVDNDSVDTDSASVHVDSDGMVNGYQHLYWPRWHD
jgi:hypothetical protein